MGNSCCPEKNQIDVGEALHNQRVQHRRSYRQYQIQSEYSEDHSQSIYRLERLIQSRFRDQIGESSEEMNENYNYPITILSNNQLLQEIMVDRRNGYIIIYQDEPEVQIDGLTDSQIKNLNHKQASIGQQTCPICLDEIKVKQHIIQLPCKHPFHRDCLVTWLNKASKCPKCRRIILSH